MGSTAVNRCVTQGPVHRVRKKFTKVTQKIREIRIIYRSFTLTETDLLKDSDSGSDSKPDGYTVPCRTVHRLRLGSLLPCVGQESESVPESVYGNVNMSHKQTPICFISECCCGRQERDVVCGTAESFNMQFACDQICDKYVTRYLQILSISNEFMF